MKTSTLGRLAKLEQTAIDSTPLPPARVGELRIDGSVLDRTAGGAYPSEQAWADAWPGWLLLCVHVVNAEGQVLGLDLIEPLPPDPA